MSKPFAYTPEFIDVAKRIISAMKPWQWCLIGGRATEIWQNPPQTPDVDVLATITDEDVPAIVAAFRAKGIDVLTVWDDLGSPFIFMKDRRKNVEVDVFGGFEGIHFAAIDSAEMVKWKGIRIPVAKREHVIALKLSAATDIGRTPEKRKRDRQAIMDLTSKGKYDRKFLAQELFGHQMTQEIKLALKLWII